MQSGWCRKGPHPAPPNAVRPQNDSPSASTGQSRETVLRAATINAVFELHQDDLTSPLNVGRVTSVIMLARNALTLPAEQINAVEVLGTFVGGEIVYRRTK